MLDNKHESIKYNKVFIQKQTFALRTYLNTKNDLWPQNNPERFIVWRYVSAHKCPPSAVFDWSVIYIYQNVIINYQKLITGFKAAVFKMKDSHAHRRFLVQSSWEENCT